MKNLRFLVTYHGLPALFLIIYLVGLLLFFLPFTRDLFIAATPFNLVLVAVAIFYYHKGWNAKTMVLLSVIFVLSILIENIGVATGKLFGVYTYGIGLGVKVVHVPVLIGLNWIILVYGSNGLVSKFTSNSFLKIVGASVAMVLYDGLLEIAAPAMKMWEFTPIRPPFENYLVWFIMAIVFQIGIEVFKVNTDNKPARALFVIQLLFFLFITIGGLFLEI